MDTTLTDPAHSLSPGEPVAQKDPREWGPEPPRKAGGVTASSPSLAVCPSLFCALCRTGEQCPQGAPPEGARFSGGVCRGAGSSSGLKGRVTAVQLVGSYSQGWGHCWGSWQPLQAGAPGAFWRGKGPRRWGAHDLSGVLSTHGGQSGVPCLSDAPGQSPRSPCTRSLAGQVRRRHPQLSLKRGQRHLSTQHPH